MAKHRDLSPAAPRLAATRLIPFVTGSVPGIMSGKEDCS